MRYVMSDKNCNNNSENEFNKQLSGCYVREKYFSLSLLIVFLSTPSSSKIGR